MACAAPKKIRFADTDLQGHVNNAVFATFFESGRVQILYDPQQPLAPPNSVFVIARITIEFKAEIRWPGEIVVGTRVTAIGNSSIKFDQVMLQSEQLVATADTVIVLMHAATRKSQALPAAAAERLKTWLSVG